MLLGAFLAVVGGCDLLRAADDRIDVRRQVAIIVVGVAAFAGFLRWAAPSALDGLLVGLGCSVGLALWVIGSSRALVSSGDVAARWRTVAFGGLGLGALVGLVGAAALPAWLTWPDWLDGTVFAHWPVADVVVSAGAVLLQLATANLLVRLVLDAASVSSAGGAGTRGGRLLGPMERTFLLGLGHLGEFTAATIVIAATCLLRFPELQAAARQGASEVTARVVIGSAVSWLIGFVGVALVYVA